MDTPAPRHAASQRERGGTSTWVIARDVTPRARISKTGTSAMSMKTRGKGFCGTVVGSSPRKAMPTTSLFARSGKTQNIGNACVGNKISRPPSFFQDKSGNNMTCANNCRGVDPNSVIIGDGAVLAASAVGGLGISGLAPVLGLGAAAAAGGVALSMDRCPASRPCRVKIFFIH